MKKIILLVAVVSVFAACKNSPNLPVYNKNLVLVDTTGLSKSNAVTDAASGNNIVIPANANSNVVVPATTTTTTQRSRSSSHAIYPANGTTTTTRTAPRRDRGWSSAAKGTAVGAGTGAIVGALVSRNKGKGAIIGALIGGGGGYIYGRSRDRRSGRVARAKARRAAGY
jgi:hypothetical protein